MSTIHELIPQAMAKVGAIAKGRKNQQQGYSFRGIDDAYAAFQPVFAELGIFVVPTVQNITREERQTKSGGALIYTTLTVKHTFYASDGSNLECVTVGEAMDSGDKSSNKAMSAAMKYALLEVFCVPTEEDNDTENHSHEVAPKNGGKDNKTPATKAAASTPTAVPHPAVEALKPGQVCTIQRTLAAWHVPAAGKKLGRAEFANDPTHYGCSEKLFAGKTGDTLTVEVKAHESSNGALWYEITSVVPF
jgi:hypothetical protein